MFTYIDNTCEVHLGDIIVDTQDKGYYVIQELSHSELERLGIQPLLRDILIQNNRPTFLTKLAYPYFPYLHVNNMKRLKKRIFSYRCGGTKLCEFKLVSGAIEFGATAYTVDEYIKNYCLRYKFETTRKAVMKEIELVYKEIESRDTTNNLRKDI